ncbi:MAG: hypothetical protein ABGW69_03430 [Nanoarchaeota archaeon]
MRKIIRGHIYFSDLDKREDETIERNILDKLVSSLSKIVDIYTKKRASDLISQLSNEEDEKKHKLTLTFEAVNYLLLNVFLVGFILLFILILIFILFLLIERIPDIIKGIVSSI